MAEVFDLYNRMRRPLGYTATPETPLGPGHYHAVVTVWIGSEKGAFLMTRRHDNGKWEALTGNLLSGETGMTAVQRLTTTVLGLEPDLRKLKLHSSERREAEKLFQDSYLLKATKKLEELTVDTARIAEARWMMPAELDKLAKEGQLSALMVDYADVVYPQ